MSSLIELVQIKKTYFLTKDNTFEALRGIDLQINHSDFLAITGESGSGKSTLMNIIGLLDRPSSGQYCLLNKPITQRTDDELAELRNKTIGFVFQSFYLLSRLTALENVCLPLFYRNLSVKKAEKLAMAMLEKVGMCDRAYHRPTQLSGGQMQRVAIARALVGKPSLLLADEPTGALDSKTSEEVMDLFIKLNKEDGATIVIVTHNQDIARRCKNRIKLYDGLIISRE